MSLLLAPLLGALEIHAPGACPATASIDARLAPLIGAAPGAAPLDDVVTVARAPDGTLGVTLTDRQGVVLGERRFPRQACDEQAEAVAVTLAIWEAQVHPEIQLRLDRLAAAPGPTATRPPAAVAAPAPEDSAGRAARWQRTLALGGVVDRQASGWAPALRLELGLGPAREPVSVRLAVTATGAHVEDVPPGRARWRRVAVGLGAAATVARGAHVALELGGASLLGVVFIEGEGFDRDASTRSLDFGGEAWLRARWAHGALTLWTGPGATAWARAQALDVAGTPTSSSLPHLALTWALGVGVAW